MDVIGAEVDRPLDAVAPLRGEVEATPLARVVTLGVAPVARPEVVLAVADAFGTLAAARSLGRAGIRVVLADRRLLVPARWSHYVTRTVSCPDVGANPQAFLDWLLAQGARHPGRVLCTTSDDLVWLMSRHRDALRRDFLLYVPPIEAIHTLLDKWRLHEACVALQIDTPHTWLPRTDEDLRHLEREGHFPLVIKPRTQAFLSPRQKGRIVREPGSLARLHHDLRDATKHGEMLLQYDPEASLPIVQAFSEASADRIYSLSGFIDETHELFVVEASRKVFQWPQHLGVGLCFEEAEVDQNLANDIRRLCRHVGYFGAFEVEFVEVGGRRQLIDFNPRFYGQMGFEVARGLNLPLFAYLGAVGDRAGLRVAIEKARSASAEPQTRAYCNRIELELILQLLRLAGGVSKEENARWHTWLATRKSLTDAVVDRDDWLPGLVEGAGALFRHASHPRSNWRAACASATEK